MSKVTTKSEVRLSYTNLLTPRAQDDEKPDVLTYSTAILIRKSDTDTVEAIKAAITEALEEGVVKKWGGKRPQGLKNPLRDGDEKTDKNGDPDALYAGHFFLNAKGPVGGKEKPILLDKRGNETESASIIYSGVNARVSLQFYPFDKAGNRGVACGISSVLSMESGEPLGGTVTPDSARDDFGVATPAGDAKKEFAEPASAPAESAADDPWATS
jgi:Protein of unknown function (DUF2815)